MCVVSGFAAQAGSIAPVVAPVVGLLAAAPFVGMWRFQHWGRILGIVLCVVLLPIRPWGTIFGVLGLAALVGSKPLFGENRLSLEQLRREIGVAQNQRCWITGRSVGDVSLTIGASPAR